MAEWDKISPKTALTRQNLRANISNTTEEKANGTSFSNVLSDAISKVNDSEVNANNKIESLIKGEDVEMHEVMLAMQESVLSLQALIEVRNKTVEAYQEISKLQL